MRNLRAILLAASVGVLTLAPTSFARAQSAPASATGKERAKKLFEEGLDLEKKGDYAGALAKYKEAEGITVTAGLRFHTGYCLEMTGKLTAALDEYEAADRMAREQNKPEVRAATAVRLEPLRARAPQIAIRLATPAKEADVQLDGVSVAAPLVDGGKSFRLDPGEHTVTARAPGFKPFTRRVQVPENVTTTVDISLERVAAAAPVAGAVTPVPVPAPAPAPAPAGNTPNNTVVAEPPAEAASGRSRVLPIVTTAGAVVLAGTGVALFLVAGSAQSKANDECAVKLSCDDRRSRVRTLDALALGGFIGAVGLGVVSVVLWTSKSPERSGSNAHLQAGPGTFAVEGSF
ncbi:MAG: hypothetical protein QOI41_5358 [Myxococcales bacterium]|nr:hypothetical protein [Myxococcales bacterium]